MLWRCRAGRREALARFAETWRGGPSWLISADWIVRGPKAGLETLEPGVEQGRHQDLRGPVGMMVGHEFRAPIEHAALAVRLYLEHAGVMGDRHPGDAAVAETPPGVIDRFEAF